MAEIIQRELNLKDLSLPSGTPEITATALAEGLSESRRSNIITYNSEYLSYYLKQDSTYEVTGINADYSGIAKVIIPSVHNGLSVTSIGASAFYGELKLEDVYIPRSITKIGARAFENCTALDRITIEDDIYYTLYFRNTAKWENVYIAEKYYDSELYKHALPGVKMAFVENDGEYDIYSVKISKNDLGAISFNNGSTYSTDIYLSDIRNSACWQMEGRIPKRYNYAAPYLLSLGQYAFANTGVKSSDYEKTITLPSTVGYIPASAFYEAGYTSIEIPDTVRGIGEYAFSRSKLMSITIPDSVISIGYSAFEYTQISRLTIPHSVTSIGSNMCNNCEYLTSVTIEGSGSIGDYAFYECHDLTELNFGDSSGITSIGISAFENTALKNIVIPPTVIWIGKKAFWGVSAEHAMFENNYGWFYTTAYGAYDGTHWKPVYTGGAIISESKLLAEALASDENFINMSWYRLEQMIAPTISLAGALLTITDYTGIADSFNVYVDGTCKAAIDAATGEVELK